ncbi:hypothetical protein KPB1_5386 [Klebsiella pneumoniae Kb140]|nr:hypothetical protein KPB1_5381 [Klebsiella pneumoniae Kb140]EYB80102.1 hypothetical protein KPB1_5386 [Klebsiella pneumoniae Kb140]
MRRVISHKIIFICLCLFYLFIGFLNSSPCTGDRLLCRCNATV